MVDGTTVQILIGILLPIFIDVVNKFVKHSRVKYLVSLVVCVLVGFAVSFFEGKLNPTEVLGSAAVVFLAAQTAYKTFYNTSKIRVRINSLLK